MFPYLDFWALTKAGVLLSVTLLPYHCSTHWANHLSWCLISSAETLTVNDVLESIGFGKFHLKITLITGITWVWNLNTHRNIPTAIPTFTYCAASVGADCRCHGNDEPQRLGPIPTMWVEAGQLSGGSRVIGKFFPRKPIGLFLKVWKYVKICFIASGCVFGDGDQLCSLGDHIWQVWQKSSESHQSLLLVWSSDSCTWVETLCTHASLW